jgi:hypothetical protein
MAMHVIRLSLTLSLINNRSSAVPGNCWTRGNAAWIKSAKMEMFMIQRTRPLPRVRFLAMVFKPLKRSSPCKICSDYAISSNMPVHLFIYWA